MRARVGIVVLSGAALLAACQVIAGIERVEKTNAATGPASSTSSSGAPNNDPCKHALPPPPPAADDPGGDVDQFYLAARTLSLVKPAGNGLIGFDLDGTCTCDSRKGTAFDGGSSCTGRGAPSALCDADGGVDDQGATLFGTVQATGQIDLDKTLNASIGDGTRTVMFYIQGWNGQKNDLDVQIGLFLSNGTVKNPGDDNHPTPSWDGNDVWSYPDVAHPLNGFVVPAVTESGYVTNGTLVVQRGGKVEILFGNAGVGLGDALIVGDLTKDASSGIVTFNGILGGRIPETDLLAAVGQLTVGGSDGYLCQNALFPGLVQPGVCNSSDIGQSAATDFKGSQCDAISTSISMVAQSAKVAGNGPVDTDTDAGPNPCAIGQPGAPSYKCN